MTANTVVHVRVNEQVKIKAANTLATMGLSLSDAIRVFLTKICAEQKLPFELKVPNRKTQAAMKEAEKMLETYKARFSTGDDLFNALQKETRKQ